MHYLIRDLNDSPQLATAESLDEALAKLGLDANDVSKAEVMIAGALPPDNWRDVTLPKHKKLTPEQKIRVEVLQKVDEELSDVLARETDLKTAIEDLRARINRELEGMIE